MFQSFPLHISVKPLQDALFAHNINDGWTFFNIPVWMGFGDVLTHWRKLDGQRKRFSWMGKQQRERERENRAERHTHRLSAAEQTHTHTHTDTDTDWVCWCGCKKELTIIYFGGVKTQFRHQECDHRIRVITSCARIPQQDFFAHLPMADCFLLPTGALL